MSGPPGIPLLKLKNSVPRSAKNSRKFPLPIKLNYHSLCNTSTLYTAYIPYRYVVFMRRDVTVRLASIQSSANPNCEVICVCIARL